MARLKIDWVQHYRDRITQIDTDIKKAIHKKDWNKKKVLDFERRGLVEKIEELEAKKSAS